jgi:hypothetical protein
MKSLRYSGNTKKEVPRKFGRRQIRISYYFKNLHRFIPEWRESRG